MDAGGTRRVELLLPIRTVLIVAAAVGLLAAFKAVGSTFLVVFVGIFLAFVFAAVVPVVEQELVVERVAGVGRWRWGRDGWRVSHV